MLTRYTKASTAKYNTLIKFPKSDEANMNPSPMAYSSNMNPSQILPNAFGWYQENEQIWRKNVIWNERKLHQQILISVRQKFFMMWKHSEVDKNHTWPPGAYKFEENCFSFQNLFIFINLFITSAKEVGFSAVGFLVCKITHKVLNKNLPMVTIYRWFNFGNDAAREPDPGSYKIQNLSIFQS